MSDTTEYCCLRCLIKWVGRVDGTYMAACPKCGSTEDYDERVARTLDLVDQVKEEMAFETPEGPVKLEVVEMNFIPVLDPTKDDNYGRYAGQYGSGGDQPGDGDRADDRENLLGGPEQ